MKHPSQYTTVPLAGLHIMQVDPGTEITDERTGRTETVTDDCAVRKGVVIWCTPATYAKLKAAVN